jgi:hypothetical protein
MTLEESIAAASGLCVTSEGYRQLRAAYNDPSHASFTADAFSSHSAANPAVMARYLELVPSDEYDDKTDVDDDIAMKQEHEAPETEPKDARVKTISSRKVLLKDAPSMALDVCVLGNLPVTLDELAAVSHLTESPDRRFAERIYSSSRCTTTGPPIWSASPTPDGVPSPSHGSS